MEGLFIVLEGVDGAGTTTHTKLLANAIERRGLPVHATREPSDGPIGVLLRQMLTGRVVVPGVHGVRAPSSTTMALLFAADRIDHLEAEILPNVHDGVTVVSDRFDYSSIAYQSLTGGGAEAIGWLREINRHARRPDLTIVLDVPAEVAAERRRQRSGGSDIFEEDVLQRALVDFYATMERHFPNDRIVHVNSNRQSAEVAEEIAGIVRRVRE